MYRLSRRHALAGGASLAGLAALGGRPAFSAIIAADVPPPNHPIEPGARLRVLRPAKFVQGDETLWLDAEPGHASRIIAQLNHFLISEQVELADRTRDVAMVRVVGPAAAALIAQALQCTIGELQPWHHAIRTTPAGTVGVRFQRALGVLGFDCACRADAAPTLWSRLLTAGVTPAGMQAHEILRAAPGVLVVDKRENGGYATPYEAAGDDATYVSRVREDPTVEHGLALWCVSDNLRKGAALNAIQIAEVMLARQEARAAA